MGPTLFTNIFSFPSPLPDNFNSSPIEYPLPLSIISITLTTPSSNNDITSYLAPVPVPPTKFPVSPTEYPRTTNTPSS